MFKGLRRAFTFKGLGLRKGFRFKALVLHRGFRLKGLSLCRVAVYSAGLGLIFKF